ncbi:cyclodeaminase/cyclohydrolase family protein [Occultella aeris]|uniref:Formiminotransferase-cyclodeaminase n=1 Tax=Occultella aeris TaxID=2761496 RepID=A0A7M4DK16_9MICO|nr:cyclodeaminase/cyclohydrolase family protein [Occultella aeris]VZO37404.1 Formiminotransferase-cyclodeaminase [Occultella aeris]
MSTPTWLDRLAAPQPDPGGGAAAGALLGVAAALASMVAGYSTDWPNGPASITALRRRTEEIRARAADLVEADGAASARFAAAFRLPEASPGQRRDRDAAIVAASIAAALTAVELGRAGLDLMPDLAALATHGNPVVISDLGVAASTLAAALRASVLMIEVDLACAARAGDSNGAGLPLRAAITTLDAAATRAEAMSDRIRARVRVEPESMTIVELARA